MVQGRVRIHEKWEIRHPDGTIENRERTVETFGGPACTLPVDNPDVLALEDGSQVDLESAAQEVLKQMPEIKGTAKKTLMAKLNSAFHSLKKNKNKFKTFWDIVKELMPVASMVMQLAIKDK